jgi:hypothetical protein
MAICSMLPALSGSNGMHSGKLVFAQLMDHLSLRTDASLYMILHVLSLTLFEKIPINQLLADIGNAPENSAVRHRRNLFEAISGQ